MITLKEIKKTCPLLLVKRNDKRLSIIINNTYKKDCWIFAGGLPLLLRSKHTFMSGHMSIYIGDIYTSSKDGLIITEI